MITREIIDRSITVKKTVTMGYLIIAICFFAWLHQTLKDGGKTH